MPFDMYTGEFSHHGTSCTFETLAQRFHITDLLSSTSGRSCMTSTSKSAVTGRRRRPLWRGWLTACKSSTQTITSCCSRAWRCSRHWRGHLPQLNRRPAEPVLAKPAKHAIDESHTVDYIRKELDNSHETSRCCVCGAHALTAVASLARAQEMPSAYKQVLDTLGKTGDFKDNVLKVNIPRNDLSITVANVKTPTPFGFGGWVALTKGTGGMDVMMGDLVLTQEEVNPVMSAILENGLEATALHNHFFWDEPRMFYMHVHGHGTPAELARKVKPALDLIGKSTKSAAAAARFTWRSAGTSNRHREDRADHWTSGRAERSCL